MSLCFMKQETQENLIHTWLDLILRKATGIWLTYEGPDEVDIAQKVADAMDRTVFYTRQELELLARQALKENNLPSGERAARYAVSHVQKYLGDIVKTHAIPGKQTWHYRFDNKGKKPWE